MGINRIFGTTLSGTSVLVKQEQKLRPIINTSSTLRKYFIQGVIKELQNRINILKEVRHCFTECANRIYRGLAIYN